MYMVLFFISSILAWVFSIWGHDIFAQVPLFGKWCIDEQECFGNSAVYKMMLGLFTFHAVLSLLTLGVKDASSGRGHIQNGGWPIKIFLWLALIIGFIFLPPQFLDWYIKVAIAGSVLFVLIQLIMLVDFAHSWNSSWVRQWEETDNKNWYRALLATTIGFYLLILIGSILLYVFFNDTWDGNTAVVTVNLVLIILVSVLSVLPTIQLRNPNSSLLTSAVVSGYMTYLVWSAINSVPGDSQFSGASYYAVMIIGALFTFVAVAFSSMRAGSHSDGDGATDERSQLMDPGSEEHQHPEGHSSITKDMHHSDEENLLDLDALKHESGCEEPDYR